MVHATANELSHTSKAKRLTHMIKLGDYNILTVVKEVDFGLYLDGGDEGEILLPRRYVPEGACPGDTKVGDFAYLEVAWVYNHGAFLDWGLMKDLFCPFREQKMRMEKGKRYIVHVHIDEESYRIMASAKVEHFLSEDMPPYRRGDEVDMLVWQKTDLGFKVIVDNTVQGLIYDSQIFGDIHTGDRMKGYVSNVREDGKIDLMAQPSGRRHTKDFAEALLEYLHGNGGTCPLGDKSDAEEIKNMFHVSKKVFKRAVGDLYRRRLISISDKSIKLNR